VTTLMWEAVAAPGRRDDLARWAVAAFPGAEVYVSADDRVVTIAEDPATPLPEAPGDLVARAPHAWPFERFPAS
jgi:hypothetical protein